GETILTYEVHATVGGKLARLGSRLIDSTARKLAAQFFDNFQAHLNEARPSPAE
ncbi:MAG: SRPBCC domain-containing protein, partial [Pseudomonadota bacterium]